MPPKLAHQLKEKIKLSEIAKRIYNLNFRGECWIDIDKTIDSYTRVVIRYGKEHRGQYEFIINNQTKMIYGYLDIPMKDEWKWLWKLWVENTEIEIDEVKQ